MRIFSRGPSHKLRTQENNMLNAATELSAANPELALEAFALWGTSENPEARKMAAIMLWHLHDTADTQLPGVVEALMFDSNPAVSVLAITSRELGRLLPSDAEQT